MSRSKKSTKPQPDQEEGEAVDPNLVLRTLTTYQVTLPGKSTEAYPFRVFPIFREGDQKLNVRDVWRRQDEGRYLLGARRLSGQRERQAFLAFLQRQREPCDKLGRIAEMPSRLQGRLLFLEFQAPRGPMHALQYMDNGWTDVVVARLRPADQLVIREIPRVGAIKVKHRS